MKSLFTLILLFVLSGCATNLPSLPEAYSGPTATIDDTFSRLSSSKANLYYVNKVESKNIHNNLQSSYHASSGKGLQLVALGATRAIAAKPIRLHLVAQVHHSAPIGYMTNSSSNYKIEGEIEFFPEADMMYRVNGFLSQEYTAVWLEDTNGNLASKILGTLEPDYEQRLRTLPELTSFEKFSSVSGGESPELIVRKFGEPNSTYYHKPNLFSQRPEKVIWYFEKLGSIQFTSGQAIPLFVEKVTPLTLEIVDTDKVRDSLENTGIELQRTAKKYHDQGGITTDVMDVFAEKIWEERNSEDRYTVDALSYFCNILGKSQNPRYKDLLLNIQNSEASKKLKRYAKTNWKLLADSQAAQFSPKSK